MSRAICESCEYTLSTCICDSISPIATSHKLVVLQHPQEAKNAKNTARLLPLLTANFQLHQGESEQDFKHVVGPLCDAKAFVLFPTDSSVAIETVARSHPGSSATTLVLIDATWRKALKMWHLNPWLSQLRSLHFSIPPQSRYKIRKAKRVDSLSTLEAAAYGLECLTGEDMSAAFNVMDAMIEHKLRQMPPDVRNRYK